MKYEKDLMASWDEYAIKKTLREEVIEIGLEKGLEKGREEFVRNLLGQIDFTISKVALLANVTEIFVRKIKKVLQ